jgi:hypothetical protein
MARILKQIFVVKNQSDCEIDLFKAGYNFLFMD